MRKNPKFSVKAMLSVMPVASEVVVPELVAIAVVVAVVQELVALLVQQRKIQIFAILPTVRVVVVVVASSTKQKIMAK